MTERKVRRPGAGRKKTLAPDLPPLSTDESLSLATRVHLALRRALMSGGLMPGAIVTSRSLSDALGVSPMPVREALKKLEVEGALQSRNKSAFFVNDPNQTEFSELLEVRLKLEGLAIEKAARVCTPGDLKKIRALNDRYQQLMNRGGKDSGRALVSNFHFHFEIYSLSGSSILIELIEANWVRIGPVLNRSIAPTTNLKKSMHAHEDMIQALAENDPELAVRALSTDLLSAYEDIFPQLRPPTARPEGKLPDHFANAWRDLSAAR